MTGNLLTCDQITALSKTPENFSLGALVRGSAAELHAYLMEIESNILIDGTKTQSHIYGLQNDGDGKVRIDSFIQAIARFAIDYAIPRSKISQAYNEMNSSGSTHLFMKLSEEAKKLFVDLEKTGEGGELLLFWFAEKVLKIPQIISKMSLKTTPNMHFQGSDGIHADIDPTDGKIRLYWCESKIHETVTGALTEAIKGIKSFLDTPFTYDGPQSNDIRLLNNFVDLGDEKNTAIIKRILDPDSVGFNQIKNSAICFVGSSMDCYNHNILKPSSQLLKDTENFIKKEIPSIISHINKKINEFNIDSFTIHVIYLPFPDVDDFRKKFNAAMKG